MDTLHFNKQNYREVAVRLADLSVRALWDQFPFDTVRMAFKGIPTVIRSHVLRQKDQGKIPEDEYEEEAVGLDRLLRHVGLQAEVKAGVEVVDFTHPLGAGGVKGGINQV